MNPPSDTKARVKGLNRLLHAVVEEPITVSNILLQVGFSDEDVAKIRDEHLERFLDCFALAIRAAFVRMNDGRLYGDLFELYFGYARAPLTPRATLASQLLMPPGRLDRVLHRALGRLRHRQTPQPLFLLIHETANTVLGRYPTRLEPRHEDSPDVAEAVEDEF